MAQVILINHYHSSLIWMTFRWGLEDLSFLFLLQSLVYPSIYVVYLSFQLIDSNGVDFLFGLGFNWWFQIIIPSLILLDMLKRHNCVIDLKNNSFLIEGATSTEMVGKNYEPTFILLFFFVCLGPFPFWSLMIWFHWSNLNFLLIFLEWLSI